jgi:phosphoribosylanthranilate isomerase
MTWVKICGITNEEDALLAIAMGADAIGFIFAQGSKRQVQPPQVADIVKRLPPEVLTIGVFRNDLPDRIIRVVERCGLTGAQLHGLETPVQTAEVAARVPFVIKAFAYDDQSLPQASRYRVNSLLIDAPTPGSGETFDWQATQHVPKGFRWILAGGLHAGNVSEAIVATNPWGVDVASGVEDSPGRKDARLVREFIRAAKHAVPLTEWTQRWPESDAIWTPEVGREVGVESSAPFDFDLDG